MTTFTKNDTRIFKGIGILMIVIHNYLHFQEGFFIENEAKFNPENFKIFLNYLKMWYWPDTFSAIAAFLGHYGVQIFIFFSAYGLSIQQMQNKGKKHYFLYLWQKLRKLYFLLLFGIAVFLVISYLVSGEFYGFERTFKETLSLITSVATFKYSTLYSNFSGPFWFFGLMVQVYVLFPLLFKLVKAFNIYQLLGICYCLIIVLYLFISRKTDFSLFGTAIGHLPEIIAGIYFAQKSITRPNNLAFITAIAIFILSQIYGSLFPFSFLSITIIMLYMIDFLRQKMNRFFYEILLYTGSISMILFVVNGSFRTFPFFANSISEVRQERIFLYLLLLFFVCHFLHTFYVYITKRLKI